MKKKFFNVLLIVLLLVGCNNKEINEQEMITEYVKNNETLLIEIFNKIDFSRKLDEENIINEMPNDIKIINAYIANDDCIEFGIDEGTSTRSHYYGFYYTKKDVPLAAGIEDKRLQEYGNGYKIQEPNNEDWYYTEKIVDNFYFYEAHY